MGNEPFVSVLMSFYNEKLEFLKLSIESILNQTYTNFEFIILSDNPNNEELNSYVSEITDARVKFIRNEKNIGLTKTLNKGLEICTGTYIIRMDADDIAYPSRIKDQVVFMEKNLDVMASGGNAIAIDEKNKCISRIIMPKNTGLMKYYSLFSSPLIHPASILRRSDSCVRYDEDFMYAQDYALWVSLLGNGYIISNLDKTILKYRYSDNQIFKKHKNEQNECADKILRYAFDNLNIELDDSSALSWRKINSCCEITTDDYRYLKNFIIDFYNRYKKNMSSSGADYIFNRLILNLVLKSKENIFKKLKIYINLLWETHSSFQIKSFCIIILNSFKA